ncbi:MAG: TIGR02647 family protein [Methylococcales bacterium]
MHGSAKPELINAAARLFEKGLISQPDGGYLTDLGIEVAEHAQAVLQILSSE